MKVCPLPRFRGCSSTRNFRIPLSATSNVVNYPMFRQTVQLPLSWWMCSGWAFTEALRHSWTTSHYTFILKMAIVMFSEMLNNSQHSTRLTTETQSYTKRRYCIKMVAQNYRPLLLLLSLLFITNGITNIDSPLQASLGDRLEIHAYWVPYNKHLCICISRV